MSTGLRSVSLKQMAACLGTAFALAPAAALSVNRIVNNCFDDGSGGSLRSQIDVASSSDTIDLSTVLLTCSTITLTAGEILIPQDILTLKGPSNRTVTITTTGTNRLLHHTGNDRLIIQYLTLTGGYYAADTGFAKGGCIFSNKSVYLTHATVGGCTAYTIHSYAKGGGVYAVDRVTLDHAAVNGNVASAFYNSAAGGGIYSRNLEMSYSTISGNNAVGGPDSLSRGGGAIVPDYMKARNSTIDSNHAGKGGGIYNNDLYSTLSLTNSTISSNIADVSGGGVDTGCGEGMLTFCAINNSTIAFNSAPNLAGVTSFLMNVQSSIIASNTNTSPGGFADLYVKSQFFSGADNLIVSYNQSGSPGIITVTSDPQLTPLANHGGLTRTHALLATSPAIDHGNDALDLSYDQRGFGFSRNVNGMPDIGAYEREVDDDEIFYSGFN